MIIYQLLAAVKFDNLGLPEATFDENTIPNALNIFFGIMGVVAVLIITIAGLKYVMSMGQPDATKKAKDTILNAFIGLIVAISANAIIQFVLKGL